MKMQMRTKSSVYSMVWVSIFHMKVLIILSKNVYLIVIFIGGVAVSISHAIIPTEDAQNIKRLAEVKKFISSKLN
jgi:hypothetical protein